MWFSLPCDVYSLAHIKKKEMLTCAFMAQVNESKVEIIYWNVCISFNL